MNKCDKCQPLTITTRKDPTNHFVNGKGAWRQGSQDMATVNENQADILSERSKIKWSNIGNGKIMPGRQWFGWFLGTLQNLLLKACQRLHVLSVSSQCWCGWAAAPCQPRCLLGHSPASMPAWPSVTHWVGLTQHLIGRAVHQSHTGWD